MMKLREARQLLILATTDGALIERAINGEFVRAMNFDYADAIMVKALEALRNEGILVKVSINQKTGSLFFKRKGA